MSQSLVNLYNMAAQTIGVRGKFITTADKHRAVEVFNLWYDTVRQIVLCAGWWQGTTKAVTLTLSVERTDTDWVSTDPAPGSQYAYELPADFLHPQYLSTFCHFSISNIGGEKLLSTHEEDPVLIYTADVEDVTLWEHDLYLAVAYALGAFCAATLTGSNAIAARVEGKANELIARAQERSANMFNQPYESVASWHQARGFMGPLTQNARYIFPHGPIVQIGESANVK